MLTLTLCSKHRSSFIELLVCVAAHSLVPFSTMVSSFCQYSYHMAICIWMRDEGQILSLCFHGQCFLAVVG